MRKIILVQPRVGSWDEGANKKSFPLGLMSIARMLDGYEVKIIDTRIEPRWKARLLEEIDDRTICVGTTAFTGTPIAGAIEISRLVKENSSVPVVWGGVHPTLFPEQTLSSELIDYIIIGEGEYTFPELVRHLEDGMTSGKAASIDGLGHKQGGRIVINKNRELCDMNLLPDIRYELIDPDRYNNVPLETSRGCVNDCAFCYNAYYNKRRWRSQTPDKIMSQIRKIMRYSRSNKIYFVDDNLFADLSRVSRLCELMLEEGTNIEWGSQGLRIDAVMRMDDAYLERLVSSGMRFSSYGIESGSQRMLDMIGKGITVSDIIMANRRLKKHSIENYYNFMCGFPGETLADIKRTISLMYKLIQENPNSNISFLNRFSPYPYTRLFDYCVSRYGLKIPDSLEGWERYTWMFNKTPWASEERNRLLDRMILSSSGLNNTEYKDSRRKILKRIFNFISRQRYRYNYFDNYFESIFNTILIKKSYA